MQRLFLQRFTVPVALAAGWMLRGTDLSKLPPAGPLAIHTERIPALTAQVPAHGFFHDQTGGGNTERKGPSPFTSLEELVLAAGECDFSCELNALDMLSVVPGLLATDLKTTERFLVELETSPQPQGERRDLLALGLLTRWLLQQPQGAVQFAANHPALLHDGNRDSAGSFRYLAMAFMARSHSGAVEAVPGLLPEGEDTDHSLLLIRALSDPERALNEMPPDNSYSADDIAGRWAHRDPQAAARWASSRTEPLPDSVYSAIAGEWALKDAGAAATWAESLNTENAQAAAGNTTAHVITENMLPQDADQLLAGLPQRIAERARLALAARATVEDLSAAAVSIADVLQRNAGDESLQKEGAGIAVDTVQRMVHDEAPREAGVWVQSLPTGTARTAAAEKLVGEWAVVDAAAASEWVTALPTGEARGAAVNALIEAIAGNDPAQALKWAKSIPAAGPRTEQIGKVMRQWLPADPFAAIRAVEALPDEVRVAIWEQEE